MADEVLERVLARRRARAGAPPTDPTTPAPPVLPMPDVEEQAARTRAATRETLELQMGPDEAAVAADDRVSELLGRPEPIARTPTIHEQAVRAFTPRGLAKDDRPDSYVEQAKELARQKGVTGVAADAFTAVPELGLTVGSAAAGKLAELLGYEAPKAITSLSEAGKAVKRIAGFETEQRRGLAEAAEDRDPTVPSEVEGIPVENTALAAMRILGSTLPAAIIEAGERIPVPDLSGMVAAGAQPTGQDKLRQLADAFWTSSSLSEELLGYDPGAHQTVRRKNPVADWLQGTLERIERGEGLETVAEEFARQRLGPEAGDAAWWLGLAADAVLDWEGAALAGPRAGARVARVRSALGAQMPPGMAHAQSPLWTALRGAEVDVTRELGDRIAVELESGRMALEDLPDVWRHRLDQVAQNRHGQTFRELAAGDGIEVGAAVSDPAFAAARAEIDEARQAVPSTKPAIQQQVETPATVAPEAPPPAAAPPEVKPKRRNRMQMLRKIEEVRTDIAAIDKLIADNASDVDFVADATRRKTARMGQLAKLVDEAQGAPPSPPKPPRPTKPMPEGTPGVTPGVFAERPGKEIRGPREPEQVRPKLPPFLQGWHVQTAADFWRHVQKVYGQPDTHPLGYDIDPGEGFRRFDDSRLQTIDQPKYSVRNTAGDIVAEGITFPTAMDRMMRRQLDGDTVWFDGTRRPVLSWGAKEEPRITADYFFASREEETLARLAREANPKAIPGRLRQLEAETEARVAARAAKRTVGGEILAKLTGAPPKPPPSTTRAGSVVREASRVISTELLGSDVLRPLPNGALVAPRDHNRILSEVTARLGMKGEEALRIIESGGKLTDAQIARFKLTDPTFSGPLTVAAWQRLRAQSFREVGGALADLNQRIEGMMPLGRKFALLFTDPHVQRFKWPKGAKRSKLIEAPFRAFTEDVLRRMPEPVRNVWAGLKSTLARNSDDLADEVRQEIKAGGTSEEVLRRIVGRIVSTHYPTVLPDQLARAEAIWADPRQLKNPATLDALRRDWRGPRPEWLDSSEDILAADGVYRWARNARDQAADIARDWIRAALADAGIDLVGTKIGAQVRQLEVDRLLPVYREVLLRGATDSESARPILAELGVTKPPSDGAIVQFALNLRAKAQVGKAVDELVAAGGAIRPGDLRMPVLADVLLDQHRTWNPAAQRWEYKHPEASTTWALNRLRDWGIEPGAGTPLSDVTIGGQAVTIPKFLLDEFESIIRTGALGSRDITASDLANKIMRVFKESVTHGVLAPNPAYYLGQLIGMLPTLVTTRGWRGAAATVATPLFKNPGMVGELVKRSGGLGMPVAPSRAPEGRILRTRTGDLYTVDELERVIRTFGLNETRPAYEVAEGLTDLLARQDRTNPIARGLDRMGKPFRWWQEVLRKAAGAVDLNARIGTFVDLVERGVPMDRAAQQAKAAVLDFRAITPFEQDKMRAFVTFYSFLRKNADAHVTALLEDPKRVLSQMRVAHASLEASGLTGLELGSMTDADVGRFAFYNDSEVYDRHGRPHPHYRLNRITSTPVGVSEWLMQMRMLTGGDRKQLGAVFNPLLQTAAIGLMGRTLDREFEAPMANRIPPILMDTFPDLMLDVFGAGPQLLRPEDDPALADPDATAKMGGEPNYAVWVAGAPTSIASTEIQAGKRQLWQAAMRWISRPLNLAELGYEVAGFEPLPPWMNARDGYRDLLLGTTTRPVLEEQEAVRRALERKARELRAAETAIRPPPGVGPR